MLKRKDLLELHFVCESRTANKLFHFKIAMINMFNYGVFVICWHSVYAKTPSQRGTSKWFGPFSQIIHIKLLLSIDSFEMNSFHWLTELCLFVSIFTWFNEFSNSMNAPRQTPNIQTYTQKPKVFTSHTTFTIFSNVSIISRKSSKSITTTTRTASSTKTTITIDSIVLRTIFLGHSKNQAGMRRRRQQQ